MKNSTIRFEKYQGTGNDFVMIDNRSLSFDRNNLEVVRKLCDRKFGIGADGLILIENHADYDFEMVYFNSDGSMSLCGNGSRCAVNFANSLGIISKITRFLAIDGMHDAEIDNNNWVHLKMSDITTWEQAPDHCFINTGSPHYIRKVSDIRNYDVLNEGAKVRYSEKYKEKGTNVNFVENIDADTIFVRTYERGVEGETLSCGTGVTACALNEGLLGKSSPINIQTLGGNLRISFSHNQVKGFSDIYLIGPAEKVFEGVITI